MRTLTIRSELRWAAAFAGLVLLVAACSSAGGGGGIYGGGAASAVASAGPAANAAPSAAASPTSSASGGGKYGAGGNDDYGSPASAAPAASSSAGVAPSGLTLAVASGAPGKFLTGDGGRTLYIFKKDSPNTSACGADCATNWPPLTVTDVSALTAGAGVTGKLSAFARADGSKQVAYGGAPLYYFAADSAAGDTNGQGIGGNWFVAAP